MDQILSGDVAIAKDGNEDCLGDENYHASWMTSDGQNGAQPFDWNGDLMSGNMFDVPLPHHPKEVQAVKRLTPHQIDLPKSTVHQKTSKYQDVFIQAIKQLKSQPFMHATVTLWTDLSYGGFGEANLGLSGSLPLVSTDTDNYVLYMLQRARYCISVQNYWPTASQLLSDLMFDNPENLLASDIKQILSPLRHSTQTGTYLGLCWLIYLVLHVSSRGRPMFWPG
jgi:hypothetical protein